jgi:5-methylcytosine-specific restriction endonuclease McrA
MPLRKAERVRTESTGFWVFGEGRFWLTNQDFVTYPNRQYRSMKAAQSTTPVAVFNDGQRTLWWYQESFYWESDNLDSEAVALLIWDRERRLNSRLSRLRKMRDSVAELPASRRERIPEDVRLFVWERDGGRCQRCGAGENLQFDHIVPASKGGSNDASNVELLCAACNQLKAGDIG